MQLTGEPFADAIVYICGMLTIAGLALKLLPSKKKRNGTATAEDKKKLEEHDKKIALLEQGQKYHSQKLDDVKKTVEDNRAEQKLAETSLFNGINDIKNILIQRD